MEIEVKSMDRNLLLELHGEVDHHGARAVMQELDRQVDAGLPKRLTLDLSGVTFMDSSGIAVLLRAHQRMRALGGAVTVTGVPAQAGKVLRAAGLDRMMKFE